MLSMGGSRALSALAVAAAVAVLSAGASAQIVEYVFPIDGAQAGTPSTGSGWGRVILDKDAGTIDWEISYGGLAGTVTAAHFHGPALPGQNAGVQVGIGTANPAVGSSAVSAGQISDIQDGLWYVNIHSTVNPGGEIRGQVVAGAVVLSEIRIDQTGADNDEYFELCGPVGASLDTLTYLVIGDGAGGSGVIEEVTPLTGEAIRVDGYFVAAEATFTIGIANLTTDLNFENSDNVTHLLVSNFTGANGDDLDTDDDGTLDVVPWDMQLDCVGLVETPGSGDQIYCAVTVGPDGTFVPGHSYRCTPDGFWTIGQFNPDADGDGEPDGDDTPKAPNPACPSAGECPGVGNCCEANGSPGCDDVECCELICSVDADCCDVEWDQACADLAAKNCEGCIPFECPGDGDCCASNGTPGCDDATCCDAVCAVDPFCCEVSWNQICADQALVLCPKLCVAPACPGEGSCCEANGTVGCDDVVCCELICSVDPGCCDIVWDQTCADLANKNCEVCLFEPPDVRINEIRIDQPGSDSDEYFELEGDPGTSLDFLWYIVIGDGAGGSGTVEAAIPLTGQVIRESGYFVAAEATFTIGTANLTIDLPFENGDNVTHLLVANFTGVLGMDLDIDDDCVLDLSPWSDELDRIALIEEENPPGGTECHYGPPTVGPDGENVPGHAYRCEPDRTWTIGQFAVDADEDGTPDGDDTPKDDNPACADCPGDTNGDGQVNVADLSNVVLAWGPCPGCPEDFNDDDMVGVDDLTTVILNWGPCP